jgi:NTE family protein
LNERLSARFERVVLLLQGGGALGAYQAGVYEALAEANLHPDWVAGISIGAINAAIIAGNSPKLRVAKLREFWERITHSLFDIDAGGLGSLMARGDSPRDSINYMSAAVQWCARVFPTADPEPMVSSPSHRRGDKLLRYGTA